jgi:hypothetical protein
MLGDLGVTIYSATVTEDSNLLITVAAESEFPPGGVGGSLVSQITDTAQAAGIEVTVEVIRFDGCPMEYGPPYIPSEPNFLIFWPEADIGQTVYESCACGLLDLAGYFSTRVCGGSFSSGGMWGDQDVSLCVFSDATLQLCLASELPPEDQANAVTEAVSDPTEVDPQVFTVAVDIIADLLNDSTNITQVRH